MPMNLGKSHKKAILKWYHFSLPWTVFNCPENRLHCLFVCKRRIRMPKKCPLSGKKKIGNHSKYYPRCIDTWWAIGLLLKCNGRYDTLYFPTKNPTTAVSRAEIAVFQEFSGGNMKPRFDGLLINSEMAQSISQKVELYHIGFKSCKS